MSYVYAHPVRDLLGGEALWSDTSPVIALFSVGGEFCTINDRCNHGSASMSRGYLKDDATAGCSLYAASSCLKTSKVLYLPVTGPLTAYTVYVDGSDMFVGIPEGAR